MPKLEKTEWGFIKNLKMLYLLSCIHPLFIYLFIPNLDLFIQRIQI